MPNIEIIALRLNLDKEQDRELFETIKSLVDIGNRNVFLKRSLLECLTEGGGGKKTIGQDKKHQNLSRPAVGQAIPAASVLARSVASGITKNSDSVSSESDYDSQDQDAGKKEAAGLVASFVQ